MPTGNRGGISVQGNNLAIRCFQNSPRIAPCTEGSIHIDGTGFWPKRLQHLVKHDGDMALLALACFKGHFGQIITVNKSLTFVRHCPREH